MADSNPSVKLSVSPGESALYDTILSGLEKTGSFRTTVKIGEKGSSLLKAVDLYDNYNEFRDAGFSKMGATAAVFGELSATAIGTTVGAFTVPVVGGPVGGTALGMTFHHAMLSEPDPAQIVLEQGRRDWAAAHPNAKDSFGNPDPYGAALALIFNANDNGYTLPQIAAALKISGGIESMLNPNFPGLPNLPYDPNDGYPSWNPDFQHGNKMHWHRNSHLTCRRCVMCLTPMATASLMPQMPSGASSN